MKIERAILALMTLVGLTALSGCSFQGSAQTPESVAGAALAASGDWKLQSLTLDGDAKKIVRGAKVTLTFSADELHGNTGCNHFSAEYTAKPSGRLSLGAGGVTEMACDVAPQQEADFLSALYRVTHYKLQQGTLTLWDGTQKNRLSFVPDRPTPLPLAGTAWQLTHFTESDGLSDTASAVLDEHPIRLRIQSNEMNGNSGCNQFQAVIRDLGNGKLAISDVTATSQEACDDAAKRQERIFLDRLSKCTKFAIRENVLSLTNDDNTLGLQFSAPKTHQE